MIFRVNKKMQGIRQILLRFINTRLRHWFVQATEPYILYPAFVLLILGVIWATTLHLISVERANAEQAGAFMSQELAATYEAQVVRTLREIDRTLKFVKYAYELKGQQAVLQDLKIRDLLPPDMVFVVSIADRKGDVVASTRSSGMTNVAGEKYFDILRQNNILWVSRPYTDTGIGESRLRFIRRLNAADGSFAGVVMVSVAAAYFVSGYEQSKLGERGVLGILGTDGVFRARRTGDAVSAGDEVDYASVAAGAEKERSVAPVSVNSWDGVRRYTSAHKLYDFPLTVIVGLSEEEQLAASHRNEQTHLWWASARTALLILFVAALGRMRWQFDKSRIQDLNERKRAEEKIAELAFFDQLTGLPNRTLLMDRLQQAMAASSRSGSHGALLFIDLDNFKTLNDTLGHDMGDTLLKQVAQRLTTCVREGDTVARLGGDEFVVILAGLNTGESDAASGIETVAEKILAELNQPYQLDNLLHRSTASIGVTLFRSDLVAIDDLMKQADLAMYRSKAAGRNTISFFDPDMEASVKERATLEIDFRRAIHEKQFLLYYQAQLVSDMGIDRIVGAEALVRWQHPQRGIVLPAEFIPMAEETGLILPLGHWVMETACTQLAIWATQPEMAHLTVAVNVSAYQLRQHDFVDQVLAVLDNTGANPQRLKLELTESLLVSNIEEVIEKMFALKIKGVGFSLDDFGTGFSSLSYLKRMPLDQLKIDYSFVREVLSDLNDASIAKTIIALAQSLGLGVIAEGVETESQRDFLFSAGCKAYQGFLFSQPLPLDGFEVFAQKPRFQLESV